MIVLYIALAALAYLMVAGFVYTKAHPRYMRLCDDTSDAAFCSFMISTFWPVTMPVFLGQQFNREPKALRKERKRIEFEKAIRDMEREAGL